MPNLCLVLQVGLGKEESTSCRPPCSFWNRANVGQSPGIRVPGGPLGHRHSIHSDHSREVLWDGWVTNRRGGEAGGTRMTGHNYKELPATQTGLQ